MITVKRDTGIVGSMMKCDIYIDGVKVGRLGNEESQEFELPNGSAQIKSGFAYIHSNPVTVKDGQAVTVKGSTLGSYLFIFGIKSSYLIVE